MIFFVCDVEKMKVLYNWIAFKKLFGENTEQNTTTNESFVVFSSDDTIVVFNNNMFYLFVFN